MPIGYIVQQNDADYSSLHQKLLEEWRNPNPNTDEPVIIETNDKMRPPASADPFVRNLE